MRKLFNLLRVSESSADEYGRPGCADYDAAIAEAARLTDERPILDVAVKLEISDRLQAAVAAPSIALNIVYFRKTGRSFAEVCGRVRNLVPHESLIIMEDGTRIKVEDVVVIDLRH